jgi:hypothetical protein
MLTYEEVDQLWCDIENRREPFTQEEFKALQIYVITETPRDHWNVYFDVLLRFQVEALGYHLLTLSDLKSSIRLNFDNEMKHAFKTKKKGKKV